MESIVRVPDIVPNTNKILLRHIDISNILVADEAVLSIDGSTTNTGVSIIRKSDGALFYSCAFSRSDGESPVRYKVNLKNALRRIIQGNTLIKTVYYEEPFIGYAESASRLMMLRTTVDEIIIENEPNLDYIEHFEISNKRWKKLFLAPAKLPNNTELEKKAVRDKLLSLLPFLAELTQDEVDAYCMGYSAAILAKGERENLESKKKVTPFKYNVEFVGADTDEGVFDVFHEVYTGPRKLLENGISLVEINNRVKFDTAVYKEMGPSDKVLIIKFDSNTHGDIILKHNIGPLSASYDYIYAIIWRKSRKRS